MSGNFLQRANTGRLYQNPSTIQNSDLDITTANVAKTIYFSGTDNVCRKYADGWCDQYVQVAFSGDVTTATGNIFASAATNLGSWPIPFKNFYGYHMWVSSSSSVEWVVTDVTGMVSLTSIGYARIVDSVSTAGVTATIYIHGYGLV